MRTISNAIVLVGLVGAALLAPGQASARDEFSCRQEYYDCLAAGIPGYYCRDEYYICRGWPIPVRDSDPAMRPE